MKKLYLIIIALLIVSTFFLATFNVSEMQIVINTQTKPYMDYEIWIDCTAEEKPLKSYTEGEMLSGGIYGTENPGYAFATSWAEKEISQEISIKNVIDGTPTVWIDAPEVIFDFPLGQDDPHGPWFGCYWWEVKVVTEGGNTIDILGPCGIYHDGEGNPRARINSGNEGLQPYLYTSDEYFPYDNWMDWHGHSFPYYGDGTCKNGDWYVSQILYDPTDPWDPPSWAPWWPIPSMNDRRQLLVPDTLEFVLKGHYTGKLVVSLINERIIWSDICYWNGGVQFKNQEIVARDEAYLQSGWGYIQINEPEGKVAEEGDTVKFNVITGYAGTTGHWLLRTNLNSVNKRLPGDIEDEYGNKPLWDIDNGGYVLSDELNAVDFTWDIPSGTYVGGQQNTWGFHLYNTMTGVAYDEVRLNIVGAEAPKVNKLTWDKSVYFINEVANLEIEGTGNSAGNGIIDRYELNVYRIVNGYVDRINPVHQLWVNDLTETTDGVFIGSTSFVIQDSTPYWVECWAWDGDPNKGANVSDVKSETVLVDDENNPRAFLKVQVVDAMSKKPLDGIEVQCTGESSVHTGVSGWALFTLDPGDYIVSVDHPGYAKVSVPVTADAGENTVTIEISSLFTFIISILIPIIILLVSIIIAWFSYTALPLKIVIIVIGITIAVISYLILSGFLVIPFLG